MKTSNTIFLLVKFFLLPILLSLSITTHASITIEMKTNKVIVSTDQIGVAGYKGCEAEQLILKKAYVYTLYKKELPKEKNGQSCNCTNSHGSWVEVGKIESDLATEVFSNMPQGEYKATVYAGQAIGCDIAGDTESYPSKSIVYQQEKSTAFNFQAATASVSNATITSLRNDALSVFPNPTSGELNIKLQDHDLKSNAQIVFYDLLGKKIKQISQTIKDEKYLEWQVDVSEFAEGAYMLRVLDGEGNSYEAKVVVTKN